MTVLDFQGLLRDHQKVGFFLDHRDNSSLSRYEEVAKPRFVRDIDFGPFLGATVVGFDVILDVETMTPIMRIILQGEVEDTQMEEPTLAEVHEREHGRDEDMSGRPISYEQLRERARFRGHLINRIRNREPVDEGEAQDISVAPVDLAAAEVDPSALRQTYRHDELTRVLEAGFRGSGLELHDVVEDEEVYDEHPADEEPSF